MGKKNAKMTLLNIALVGCLGVLGVTGTLIWKHYNQLGKSNDKVKELQATVTASSEPEENEEEKENFVPTKAFYQQMKEKYPDYIGWVQWDSGIVSEPVVQGATNDQYLRTDMDGQYDIYGTVFMDAQDSLDDPNIVLYGHSIPGDYTSVVKFNQFQNMTSTKFADYHRTFKFYLEDRIDSYEVFSAFVYGAYNSNPYEYAQNTFVEEGAFKEWIRQSINHSLIGYRDIEATTVNDKYMTFQTCADDDGNRKDIVIGIRTGSEAYPE